MDVTLNPINKDGANIPATHNGDGNIYFNAIYDGQYGGRMVVEVGYGHVFFR